MGRDIAAAGARFSWNGREFATSTMLAEGADVSAATLSFVSSNTAYRFDGFYADAAFSQSLGTTCEIAALTADTTVYAKFTMLIFSASLDEPVPANGASRVISRFLSFNILSMVSTKLSSARMSGPLLSRHDIP